MKAFLKNTEVCGVHHIALNYFLGIQNTAYFQGSLFVASGFFKRKDPCFIVNNISELYSL